MRTSSCIIGLFLFISCLENGVLNQLNEIEGYIQHDPKNAYRELCEMKSYPAWPKKEQALYSLLLSMALDKNYIDVKSDSIISPAVLYYSRHGRNQHRFLSYYYRGRVAENAADYNDALSYYLKAEENINKTISKDYQVRLYTAKQRVYYRQFAYDKAIEQVEMARRLSISLDNPLFYLRNTLDLSLMYSIKQKYDEAAAVLDTLKTWITENNVQCPSTFYSSLLRTVLEKNRDREVIDSLFSKYTNRCKEEGVPVDALIYARTKEATGDYNEAIAALSSYKPSTTFNAIYYYHTLYLANKKLGQYKDALDNLLEYQILIEKQAMTIFNNDTRFLEERYSVEMMKEKNKRKMFFLVAIAVFLSTALVVLFVLGLKRKRQYDEEIENAKSEYYFLKEIMSKTQNAPEGVDKALESRLKALRPFVVQDKWRPSNLDRKQIKKMTDDKQEMYRSIGLIYAMAYPEFTASLVKRGLTTEEIGLCAMYVAGYSVKELPSPSTKSNLYLVNGEIRKKLQIPANGVKLNHWLHDLFASVYIDHEAH